MQRADFTEDLFEWIQAPENYLNYHKMQNMAFRMPFDVECPNFVPQHQNEHYCPNFEFENEFEDQPPRGEGFRDYVYFLFNQIQKARLFPTQYADSAYITLDASRMQLYKWNSMNTSSTLKWSQGISRAIRQVLNDQGSCQTYGDSNSNYVHEVLQKHFSHHIKNLQLLEVTAPELVLWLNDPESSAIFALDYILGEESIDNSILTTTENLYMGIGCACASGSIEDNDGDNDEGKQWTCIIGVAN